VIRLANSAICLGVIYGSTILTESNSESSTRERLRQAAEQVVRDCDEAATLLWEMSYTSQSLSIYSPPVPTSFTSDPSGHILAFPPQPHDIAFDDSLLDTVKAAWEKILGPAAEGVEFMRFEPRFEDLDDE
jgi:Rab proteins geranylgeranyltransferase component A